MEQEEKIAKELSHIEYEKQREEKIRQHIKENRYVHRLRNSSVLSCSQHLSASAPPYG